MYVLLLYLISAKVQSRKFKETDIAHTNKKCNPCTAYLSFWIVYLDLWTKHWISARDGAYGYVPLNIPPRVPRKTTHIYRDILLLNHRHQGTVLEDDKCNLLTKKNIFFSISIY